MSARFRQSPTSLSQTKKRTPGEQVGTLQAIWGQDRTEERKASRTDMEDPTNAMTYTIRNLARFDGTQPENYRDWYSKTRVVLSLPNQDVFGVLNSLTGLIPVFANAYTADVSTNLDEISRWKRVCENLLSITCLLYTSPSPRDKRQSRMPSSA